ncbi:MAG: PDZ domain-containing protein [Gammaproteobacteria bacterium]|nr:PDZ domain-containing protein [Gammaproteobacteria bacterium]
MSQKNIHYIIKPVSPEAHLFKVSCIIQQPDKRGIILSLPTWIPGSYMIRDFAKNVVQLNASTQSGYSLEVSRQAKSRWKIQACEETVIVHYEVYAWDLSVRTAHLDTTHGFFNGTSVFVMVEGQDDQPCSVEILPPNGEQYQDWRIATSMTRDGAELYGFGQYQAKDYDELVDHPVEMGDFTLATFEVANTPHDVVITGHHRADMPRLCSDLKKICETHIGLFGELPKMERYTFLVMAVGDGYGGLEHRASTSLLCRRNDLPLKEQDEITDGYRTFLGLCSHEYFHTWNIKRIKPQAFLPYDLSQETLTRQLWAFEGITSYYDDLGLVRSGLITKESYLELLGQTATRVWRGQGRFKQSVADSSFDAWTKFYKQDENAPNAIVSYYTKGALIALALDLTLRQYSNNEISLDDLMRQLWQDYGKPEIGVKEGEIEKLASELVDVDLSDFFNQYLYNTKDIPLKKLLSQIGIDFTLRPATDSDDIGGKPITSNIHKTPVTLGARIVENIAGAMLSHIFDNSASMQAGLAAGDVVIALNGIQVNKANIEKIINTYTIGDKLKVHAFRRDELMEFDLILQNAPEDTCVFLEKNTITEDESKLQDAWLLSSN